MSKLYKDLEDNIVAISSINGFVPEGYTEVPIEEVDAAKLVRARSKKMAEIRAQRDSMLIQNDKMWLIESKKGNATTDIEADAVELRNMTTAAQTAVDAIIDIADIDDIKNHDAFSSLTLTQTYE